MNDEVTSKERLQVIWEMDRADDNDEIGMEIYEYIIYLRVRLGTNLRKRRIVTSPSI